jgi:hypothetical protein
MAGEHAFQRLLLDQLDRLLQAEEEVHRHRADEALRLARGHLLPVEVVLGQLGLARGFERLVADAGDRHAGRHHQALLAAGDGDVDAPGIHLVFHAAERGDRVGEQQRRMLALVERAADLGKRQHHAGRGFVVDGEHGLDLVTLVGGEPLAELGEFQPLAPVGADDLDLEAECLGQFLEAQ